MRKIYRWMNDIFSPKQLQGLDAIDLVDAMNDPVIRKTWLWQTFEELKRLNLEVDKGLMSGSMRLNDLSARRKAYQDVLEGILSAKRTVSSKSHNPKSDGSFDLDSVTVQTSPYK